LKKIELTAEQELAMEVLNEYGINRNATDGRVSVRIDW
jgi:hypothetical protein